LLQLIIGISLGLIFLFVVILLVTEMAATYPVWKQFDSALLTRLHADLFKNKTGRNGLKSILLVLACFLGFCIVGLLVSNSAPPSIKPVETTNPTVVVQKQLADSATGYGYKFSCHTKWQDGKIYCNNRIYLQHSSAPLVAECRFELLDKDGFLLKEFSFTPADFFSETQPDGELTALLNHCKAEMGIDEYLRIEKLQVVLDKKITSSP